MNVPVPPSPRTNSIFMILVYVALADDLKINVLLSNLRNETCSVKLTRNRIYNIVCKDNINGFKPTVFSCLLQTSLDVKTFNRGLNMWTIPPELTTTQDLGWIIMTFTDTKKGPWRTHIYTYIQTENISWTFQDITLGTKRCTLYTLRWFRNLKGSSTITLGNSLKVLCRTVQQSGSLSERAVVENPYFYNKALKNPLF